MRNSKDQRMIWIETRSDDHYGRIFKDKSNIRDRTILGKSLIQCRTRLNFKVELG